MTRRHVTFDCEGSTLVGTIDDAVGETALLIVSGGNEIRCGAWGGQARFAARIAAAGFPVFRFDRRGVLWRSGQHHGATDADLPRIAALGLASVFDLRSGKERTVHPCRRPEGFTAVVHVPADMAARPDAPASAPSAGC